MTDLMGREKLLRSKLDNSYFLAQKYVRPKKDVKLNVFEKIANSWDWSTFLPGGFLEINVNERHLLTCAKILGWLHSLIFLSAVLSTVGLGYGLVLPYYIQHKHPVITSLALPFGTYLTVNIAFHIWMCFTTSAGSPSKQDVLDPELPFCSSCLLYKPERTHHCRICNKCILKMDHHCVWFNNCIGHGNHRYYFLHLVYLFVGCVFLFLVGLEVCFYETRVLTKEEKAAMKSRGLSRRFLVCVMMALCTVGMVVTFGLILYQSLRIGQGRTCVEETKRTNGGQDVQHNYGVKKNFRLLLGMTNGRGWEVVLFPTPLTPLGDGRHWDLIKDLKVRWNNERNKKIF